MGNTFNGRDFIKRFYGIEEIIYWIKHEAVFNHNIIAFICD
jgi:hypothetical protein